MTLGEAMVLLRRQIRAGTPENPSGDWDDDDLRVILNMAIHRFQARVEALCPESFVSSMVFSLEAGNRIIKSPLELISPRVVQVKWTPSAGWVEIEPLPFELVKGQTKPQKYAMLGEHFYLGSIPEVDVENGFKVWGAAVTSLAEKGESLPVKLIFHHAIILEAKIIAYGETDQVADAAYQELERHYYPIIPDAYRRPTTVPEQIRPDLVKRYGRYRNARRRGFGARGPV